MDLNDFIGKETKLEPSSDFSDEKNKIRDQDFRVKSSNKIINKKVINDLVKNFKIEEIEAGIVKYYFKNNKLVTKNKFIKNIISLDSNERVYNYFCNLGRKISFSEIEKLFELIIPPEDKRINGVVYTPNYIVDYIVNNTIKDFGTVCDCSCGAGAFLLGSLRRLKKMSNKTVLDIIENNIYGVDISPLSVRRAKILLTIFAIENNEDKDEINFNILTANSLESDWENLFPDISKKGGFDFVVGNPPYVRIQDLNSINKEKLLSKWNTIKIGNFNLYFAFFELGMNILKNKGLLGYITPNNYFTSLAGIQLRQWLSKKRQIYRILNFNHLKIFDNAQTYTCITFMNKDNNNKFFDYYYLENKELLNDLDSVEFSRYFYEWLENKKWRLMNEQDYKIIKKIETIGTPLGELCSIRAGIATLKDNIFFVEDYGNDAFCRAKYNNKEYKIEKSITRKVLKISSIKNETEIPYDKRRIIFPYKKENGKFVILTEEELKNYYPKCYQYLLSARNELKQRDKGKKSYPIWFAWGRTQGMNFTGKRLYTRTFYNKPDFMLDNNESSFFCNGYAIFCNTRIEEIQKILNSGLMNYYIKKTSVEIEGNYQCYQKNFIEKFTIPEFSSEEWNYIKEEKNKEKLDTWLFERYGINN